MSDEPLLPPRVTLLGVAMLPVLEKLEQEIDRTIQPSIFVLDMKDILPKHLDTLVALVQSLEKRLNRFMPDVVSNSSATDGDVYRAVGGFEALIDDLLAGYQGICALNARGSDKEARDLLAGIYRHTLNEVRDWLQELVETLADPMATVIKRGLPTNGYVELPLMLTFTGAPQLPALERWARKHAAMLTTPPPSARYQPPPRRSSGLGFWGMVGAAVLGWGIGEALFGDDDCEV